MNVHYFARDESRALLHFKPACIRDVVIFTYRYWLYGLILLRELTTIVDRVFHSMYEYVCVQYYVLKEWLNCITKWNLISK